MRAPNVLTISPACPFLDTFVDALLAGAVVPGFAPGADPLALADATIYVPTRRAARALADVFLARAAAGATVLPRILPLGALEATETQLIFEEPDPDISGLPLPPAASSIWRRVQLATLIQAWANAIGGALRRVEPDGRKVVDEGEPFRVATSAVDAFALAGDLAGLIDELRIEDVEWRALDDLRMADFDDYWRITTTFLSIAVTHWPEVLARHGFVDPAQRQIALVEAQADKLARDGDGGGPVIAIGSTGTNKATARLLAAIARAPCGAVVLPGLDHALDDTAWTIVSGRLSEGEEPSFGHPQAAMARLLPILGISRTDVHELGTASPAAALRARFVAEALRPADTTEHWRDWHRTVPPADLATALGGVSLIEAADEREEALCLAIAMRQVLETPGRTAALVTPDRDLSRRVRGELLRWGVEVFDTGGEALAARPLGNLARLVVAAGSANGRTAQAVGNLLAHPLASFGERQASTARQAETLDVGVLRAVALGEDADAMFTEAREICADHHAHPAQRAISPEDWQGAADLWRRLVEALAPLTALDGAHDLPAWVAAHRASLAAIAGPAAMDEAQALDDLFDELGQDETALRFDAEGYGILFGRLASEATLRNTSRPHPNLAIYGLLEARLMRADVVICGGLDETIWPPQTRSDAFLNRPMRHELGLTPPERRIGQTAHDFEQAMGAPAVILSRARKRGGAPCVASRFLLRMEALGDKAWAACRNRGADILQLARIIDDPQRSAVPIERPRPTPPVALRPVRLSVTEIETLRRDPYSIYAAKILRLAPLPAIGAEIDPGMFGSLMHQALHEYAGHPAAAGPQRERRGTLRAILLAAFAEPMKDPMFSAFRWPVIEKTMDMFLSFDGKQRETVAAIETEQGGKLLFDLADLSPFTLTARADRIDRHRDGSATLIDYKTGAPPGAAEVQVGFAPQLTLEAAMLRDGGFGARHEGEIRATYVKLGGKDGGFVRNLDFKDEAFAEVVQRHFENLKSLIASFRNEATPYVSRPFPKYARDYGDFDHLARVREWSLAGAEETAP